MNVNKKEKELLLIALETDCARRNRAIRGERNQNVKEHWTNELNEVVALAGRLSNEVAK